MRNFLLLAINNDAAGDLPGQDFNNHGLQLGKGNLPDQVVDIGKCQFGRQLVPDPRARFMIDVTRVNSLQRDAAEDKGMYRHR